MHPNVEETYVRKTPLEHVLLRPGMYVGPAERLPPATHWTLRAATNDRKKRTKGRRGESATPPWKMERREMGVAPALLKVFDEILVNASDNRLRNSGTSARIDVTIDRGEDPKKRRRKKKTTATNDDDDKADDCGGRFPMITVTNDGAGIPVQMHEKEGLYVPELLFGHLLTGSNFDDDVGGNDEQNGAEKQRKDGGRGITGGRHGYGAKLANIFSKKFTVETADSVNGKIYRQTWENNMRVCHPPEITDMATTKGRRGGRTKRGRGDYTRIEFVPDVARLMGDDSSRAVAIPVEEYELMKRRVVDAAGCCCTDGKSKVVVTLNGDVVPVSGFEQYANLYRSSAEEEEEEEDDESPSFDESPLPPPPLLYHRLNPRWEVAIGASESSRFESISFVNGMHTSRGGTHVNAAATQICKYVADKVASMPGADGAVIAPHSVRRNLFLCLNALVERPSFDSQMKEYLTSHPRTFGTEHLLPDRVLRKLVKPMSEGGPGLVERVAASAEGDRRAGLLRDVQGGIFGTAGGAGKKSTAGMRKRVLSIPKLEDANHAGEHSRNEDCTLILTEGDSAKALAVAGFEIVGRDRFGVFPLRGKFLNVRDATLSQLASNAELKSLCAILGLEFDKTYDTIDERRRLRYGHVMLMTDQDPDGSHIKGLVINLFRHFWPALLKPPVDVDDEGGTDRNGDGSELPGHRGFLSMFVTPLLKATKKGGGGKKKTKETLSFFSASEYRTWRENLDREGDGDEIKRWTIKYYKGLGTSTPAEAKEYFVNFESHLQPLLWTSERDGEQIDLAFERDRAADRRDWILSEYGKGAPSSSSPMSLLTSSTTISSEDDGADGNGDSDVGDINGEGVTYADFVDKELIHFSNANNVRSLPCVVDGLKPSQRKVLHACFKRNLREEIKVAQLAGYCAEHTSYHHGEASLYATIIGMATDFVGSNNINLLVPSGQFGTRLMGGKDAASPRYIFTKLSPYARLMFPDVDDALLDYREEDGQTIEPEYFCPVIPLLLVNGCQGIGTGWSTLVPPHDPKDVLRYVRARLEDGTATRLPPIRPYVNGFSGNFPIDPRGNGYLSEGIVERNSKTSVIITELPVGVWTSSYKENLVKMLSKGEINSFSQGHTTTTVMFDVKLNATKLDRIEKGDMLKYFKLRNAVSTRNMHAFTPDMEIARYTSPEEIVEAFFPVRLGLYNDRKSLLESNMRYSASVMRNKARFIELVAEGKVDLLRGRKSKMDTIFTLEKLEFLKQSELDDIKSDNNVAKRRLVVKAKNDEDDERQREEYKHYDYLLNMPLSSLTTEKIVALQEQASKTESELEAVKQTSAEDFWRNDLNMLEPHL